MNIDVTEAELSLIIRALENYEDWKSGIEPDAADARVLAKRLDKESGEPDAVEFSASDRPEDVRFSALKKIGFSVDDLKSADVALGSFRRSIAKLLSGSGST